MTIVSFRPINRKPLTVSRFDPASGSPYDQLTDAIIMSRAAAGTLEPAVLAALLAAVRQPAREGTR